MRPGLEKGVWYNSASALLTGAGGVMGGTASGPAEYIGWAGMVLGLALLIWGFTLDGDKWWRWRRRRREIVTRIPLKDAFDIGIQSYQIPRNNIREALQSLNASIALGQITVWRTALGSAKIVEVSSLDNAYVVMADFDRWLMNPQGRAGSAGVSFGLGNFSNIRIENVSGFQHGVAFNHPAEIDGLDIKNVRRDNEDD